MHAEPSLPWYFDSKCGHASKNLSEQESEQKKKSDLATSNM